MNPYQQDTMMNLPDKLDLPEDLFLGKTMQIDEQSSPVNSFLNLNSFSLGILEG
jgi:hypothetical protein